jgi:hypothetical protein
VNAALLGLTLSLVTAAPPRTMRLDYFHTGDVAGEVFAVDRIVVEPLPWPGNPARPLDDSNRGKYFFEVIDRGTNRVVYSRGFSSIFGEWQTTDEARAEHRTFSESLRFPMPARPVQISVKKRDASKAFRELWSVVVDPSDKFVDRATPPSPGRVLELQKAGDPSEKVDLLILGDGYTAAEQDKFEKDARRLLESLFAHSPFKERRQDFNVWGLAPAAAESGVSRPSTGLYRRSPFGATYDVFDSERYMLTFENRTWRDAASFAPYDVVEIVANGRTYGGGGIFGLYSTVASDNAFSPYIFVHEFGHHFADLADEYYTSDVSYTTGGKRTEPWEPNVTADPQSPKWKALLTPGVPLPTPWRKAEFEKMSNAIQEKRRKIRADRRPEEEMEALFAYERTEETKLLGHEAYAGKVGVFEGANYEATGYYRSQADCVMFTRDDVPFCAACRSAIEAIIDLYTRP